MGKCHSEGCALNANIHPENNGKLKRIHTWIGRCNLMQSFSVKIDKNKKRCGSKFEKQQLDTAKSCEFHFWNHELKMLNYEQKVCRRFMSNVNLPNADSRDGRQASLAVLI